MQVCTDRSLSQRRREQHLRAPTPPTPHPPQGLKMSSIPVHLSALEQMPSLQATRILRHRRQRNGAFALGNSIILSFHPTLNSPTGIRRELEKNQLLFPLHKLRSRSQKGPAVPSPVFVSSSLLAALISSLLWSRPIPCNRWEPSLCGPGISKALPKCLVAAV